MASAMDTIAPKPLVMEATPRRAKVKANSRTSPVNTKSSRHGSCKKVTFVGAEYIEFDVSSASVVRLCGAGRATPGTANTRLATPADLALEWKARGHELEAGGLDANAVQAKLWRAYENEMRAALKDRGFPCLDTDDVDLQLQWRLSELLLAWSAVKPHASMVEDAVLGVELSLDEQRKHLELFRKEVFGPATEGYVFGRRFFSIDSYLATLDLEELVQLANVHAVPVQPLSPELIASVKVADRELIAIYSSGAGKPLKSLTFRELVEEAHSRGLDVEEIHNAKLKKSKKLWIDRLRPVLHAEVLDYKRRGLQIELLHESLAAALEVKMAAARITSVVELVRDYLARHIDDTDSATLSSSFGSHSNEPKVMDAVRVRKYLVALVRWHDAAQVDSSGDSSGTITAS